MKSRNYKDLVVWKKSMDLVLAVYELTGVFPTAELYGLTAQMRRSVVSIPSNIAEGSKRGTPKDFRQFILVSYGSGAELETQVEIARRLSYGMPKQYDQISNLLDEVMRMLHGMIESLSRQPVTLSA